MTELAETEHRDKQIKRVLKEADELTEPLDFELPGDRTRETKTPGFSRMRRDWDPAQRAIIDDVQRAVQRAVLAEFSDAYELMNELFLIVRTPIFDDHGVLQCDEFGQPLWERTASGNYIEDWSAFGIKQREDLLYKISTRLLAWDQKAQLIKAEALYAKADWEEAFSIGFDSPEGRLTVDDRTHKGRLFARDERYRAITKAMYSNLAESVVRQMTMLNQRLKDTTV